MQAELKEKLQKRLERAKKGGNIGILVAVTDLETILKEK